MANQGYGRNPGDMDETQVYRGGFVPQDDTRVYTPQSGQDGYYTGGYDDPGYGQSYDPNYAQNYNPNYGQNYDPNYGQGYDPNYGQSYDSGYDQSYDQNYDQNYDSGYDQDYYDDYNSSGMSMAARAAGKANPDPYGRPQARQPRRKQPSGGYSYEEVYQQPYQKPVRRRRKKHHFLRNFFIVLLILAALLGLAYAMLFQAPEQTQDGVHTRKAGFFNILVAATDEEGTRTDTMMIATLDSKGKAVSLTSIPRDTIVSNGEYVPKLNGVYGLHGGGERGAEALLDEIEKLLGFRPDGYALIDYKVFKDAVEALGGVSFDVPMEMTVDDPDTGEPITLAPGQQVLNGDQALAVCRYRYGYLMADIQRQYVQQSFLKAMVKECTAPGNWTKLPAVYDAAMDNMVTNLSGANLRYLALKALLGGLGDIEQNTLPGEGVDYNGASCYGLYGQSVVDMVNEVMNPYEEQLTIDDVNILTVSGGYLVESTWRGEAFDASTYQYN